MLSFPMSSFQLSVESNLHLLCSCIIAPCDWLKQLAPFLQPIRSNAKANGNVFPSSCDWFILLFASVVTGQNDYFGFVFTTLS